MTKTKPLTKRQRALLEEFFSSDQDEQKVLDACKVNRKLFNRWMSEDGFAEQLDKYISGAYRRGALYLARSAFRVANNLVKLTECSKEEVARKACLDIIPTQTSGIDDDSSPSGSGAEHSQLPTETAGHLLAILAEKKTGDMLPIPLRGQAYYNTGP